MSEKMFNRALFKANAKAKLKGKWLVASAITLLYMVFGGFSFTGSSLFPDNEAISSAAVAGSMSLPPELVSLMAISGALIFFAGLLVWAHTLAFSKWSLNVAVGSEAVGIGDYLAGFRHFLKAIGAGLWQQLWIGLWMMLFFVPAIIAFVFGLVAQGGTMGSEFTTLGVIAIIIGAVLYLLGVVVGVIKGISYSQMYFVLAEEKIGVLRSMRISKRLTKDYLGELFILQLSFILWYLLVPFTLGLAFFFVYPYTMATYAEAYLFLRDDAFDKGLLEPSEFGLKKVEPVLTQESLDEKESLKVLAEAEPKAQEMPEVAEAVEEISFDAPEVEEVTEGVILESIPKLNEAAEEAKNE